MVLSSLLLQFKRLSSKGPKLSRFPVWQPAVGRSSESRFSPVLRASFDVAVRSYGAETHRSGTF